jgi:hypothetical protein
MLRALQPHSVAAASAKRLHLVDRLTNRRRNPDRDGQALELRGRPRGLGPARAEDGAVDPRLVRRLEMVKLARRLAYEDLARRLQAKRFDRVG